MGISEPREVFRAADAQEAYFVRDALEQAGIETFVVGDILQTALGILPIADLAPRVLVHVEDYDRACKIIHELEAIQDTARRGGGRWRCAHCGEMNASTFDLCWHCESNGHSAR